MNQILNDILSSILQIGVLTLIPYLLFRFKKNKSGTFLQFIGVQKAPPRSTLYGAGASLILLVGGVGLIFVHDGIQEMLFDPNSVTGRFRLEGFTIPSFISLLVSAWLKTSLSEEIFFRGFVAKRLIARFGFQRGNLLQAGIFALVHLLIFWNMPGATLFPLLFIFVFPGFAGWVIAYINERTANGSIIPGWIAHGLGNMLSYSVVAYML